MPSGAYFFPNGFLWGTATAAHQVEGENTNNNWSAWEERPGRIAYDQRSGRACDWWGGRWKEDFDRAAETNQNAHRMSIEWSRVQPGPDVWDESALDYYREIVRGLVSRGLRPMITLHHFTDPLWLVERGAWEIDDTPGLFEGFVRKVVSALQEYVTDWITINEPNVYVYGGYLGGGFPPGKNDQGAAFRVMRNMLLGHARAYRVIHNLQRSARVCFALHYRGFRPASSWFFLDDVVANTLSQQFNMSFINTLVNGKFNFMLKSQYMPEVIGTQDFIGLNYYTLDLVRFNLFNPREAFSKRYFPADAELSDSAFIANVPEALMSAIKWLRRFNLPIIITENGLDDADDHLRPRYLLEHIHQLWRAVNANWQIKGYIHWTLVDNFEWERGWTQRFGLWGLEVETQARIRRISVDVYQAICSINGISSETVAQYCPELLPKLFPG
ncbi:MAG TPA: family 1 glycosylhydrolase [Anaerolineaceae bacterium]